MKRQSIKNLLMHVMPVMLFSFLMVSVPAQDPVKVTRSKEKVLINGTIYLLHQVKKGQTLFSIAKAYGISQEKLKNINPSTKNGLDEGEVLKIPESEMSDEMPEVKVEIEKSDEKVKIEGKNFFLHQVKKGHTLYSISRAYEISQKDIALANPNVFDGIKVGKVLKIPEEPFDSDPVIVTQDDSVIYHIIKEKGETLYSISKKYDVSIESILEANPEVEYSSLQINQVLKIVKISAPEATDDTVKVEEYIYHRVHRRETLYRLAQEYNVTVEEIEETNPEVKADGLKHGTIIKIPNPEYKALAVEKAWKDSLVKAMSDSTKTERMLERYFYSQERCDTFDYKKHDRFFKVALMLPFYIGQGGGDTTMTDNERSKLKLKRRSHSYYEFYQGVLMAIDSLKQKGMKLELRVFDTNADSVYLKGLLQKPEMKDLDIILGPVFSRNVKVVARFAAEYDIPVVAPLSTDTFLLNEYSNLLQVNPFCGNGLDLIADFVAKDTALIYHYMVMHTGDTANDPRICENVEYFEKRFKQAYTENGGNFDSINYVEFMLHSSKKDLDTIRQLLDVDKENILIIPSTNEVVVSKVISVLNLLSMDYHITLVGYPVYPNYSSLDQEYFHNLNFHHFTPFYVDFSEQQTRRFLQVYRKQFGTDPVKSHYLGFYFALLGYDISSYFLEAMMHYGKDFCHCLQYHTSSIYLSDYQINKNHIDHGLTNCKVHFVNYFPDISVHKVDKLVLPNWKEVKELYNYEDDKDNN